MKKVLIVGSGISGLSCAIQSAALGLHVILAAPFPSERAQSVMAAGGINAALDTKGENDTAALHAEDTLRGGCFIAGREEVYRLCQAAPEVIGWLEQMGMVFTRDSAGNIDLRAFGGQSRRRTAFSGACTGKQIVTALVGQARRYECGGLIERRLGLYFYSGLIHEGRCQGALFYNERTGKLEAVAADAVVMAVGGQNQVFGKTTGSMLCDGYAHGKLFEQGVDLKNLEFIQYHPTTVETPMKRMLITEGARGEGGRLYYLEGDRRVYFMEDKFGEKGNLMPRDIVSKCIYDAPSQVYLDITFLGEKKIRERLLEVYELCRDYLGLDVTRQPIPVYPSVHFFMGGFAVDEEHRTNIRNLYAVGECASIYHGANRLGGNSLLAAVYGGRTAARHIAGTESAEKREDFRSYVAEQEAEMQRQLRTGSQFPAVYLRQGLARMMNEDLGITRREDKLLEGLDSVDYDLSVVDKLNLDTSVSFYQAYSLRGMLVLSRAILKSALLRRESRGAHIREDYPETREEFASPSIIHYDGGKYTVEYPGGGCHDRKD